MGVLKKGLLFCSSVVSDRTSSLITRLFFSISLFRRNFWRELKWREEKQLRFAYPRA